MKKKILFFVFTILIATIEVSAQNSDENIQTVLSAYRSYAEVKDIPILVPTVVEIQYENQSLEGFNLAILDQNTNKFEPNLFLKVGRPDITTSVYTLPERPEANFMIDNNPNTYSEFPLIESSQANVQIFINSAKPITSSNLKILLDNNVALPINVEIRALINNKDQIVVAKTKLEQANVYFPKTTSDRWTIIFDFIQPLRISELKLTQEEKSDRFDNQTVRFLAQPKHSYLIYFDPDRITGVPLGESGDLYDAKDILKISSSPSKKNPNYIISDIDKDGVADINDNCVLVYNPKQEDINANSRGDACDDFDQDRIINSEDNCPNLPNRSQSDEDSDGIGDACDGEESRITERYTWLPWAGIGLTALIVTSLFFMMMKGNQTKNE